MIPIMRKYFLLVVLSSLFTSFLSPAQPPARQEVYLSGKDNNHTSTRDFFCTGGRKSGYWSTIEFLSRWPDLLRIALRRNDPAFLADKIYTKLLRDGNPDATAVRTRLMTPANWYLPFKF